MFNGPPPRAALFASPEEEQVAAAQWIRDALAGGIAPPEVGIFARSRAELARARAVVEAAGLPWTELTEQDQKSERSVAVGTMHLAKGLEFKAVAVIACDDAVLPLQSRLEAVADETELDEVYETERHLLYVACTRARDRLLISGVRLRLRIPCGSRRSPAAGLRLRRGGARILPILVDADLELVSWRCAMAIPLRAGSAIKPGSDGKTR